MKVAGVGEHWVARDLSRSPHHPLCHHRRKECVRVFNVQCAGPLRLVMGRPNRQKLMCARGAASSRAVGKLGTTGR